MTNNTYNTDSLKVMSDIGHIRKRSGMYIGESSSPEHLAHEAFDNALDESQNGYTNIVRVTADTKNHIYSVYDEGRGIPVGTVSYDYQGFTIEMEALKLLVSVAKSGGKFDNDSYKISGGLHGLGLCCITALSEEATFITRRDGKKVTVHTHKGIVDEPIIEDAPTEPNGVTVTFKGDDSLFDTTEIPKDYLYNMCNTARAFGHPVELIMDNKQVELESKSLYDLLPVDKESTSEYTKFIVEASDSSGQSIRVAMKYTSEVNCKSVAYTNLIPNRLGGTHVRAVQSAIEEVWKEFYTDSPEYEIIQDGDCRLGLRFLVGLFISEPEFSSQTKDRLSVSSSRFSELIESFKESLRTTLKNDNNLRNALLKRFLEYRRSQNSLLAQKEIMSLIKVNNPLDSSGRIRRRSVVHKLWECKSSKKEGTQLYIVEGNSAAGGLSRARDRVTQAILPLRGKIKNVAWMSIKDALKSETIRDIVNSIGAGVGEDADPELSRYEEILITADADPDGKHITALVLGATVNMLPKLVKAGMVKVVIAPLYGYTVNGVRHYTNDFDEIPKELVANKQFTRYKGLGELDDEEIAETLLDRENQVKITVDYPDDLESFNNILGTSWGRSDLLQELGIIRYA